MFRWALLWIIGWITVTGIWFTLVGGFTALRSPASLPGVPGLRPTRRDRWSVVILALLGHLLFFAVLWPFTFLYLIYVGIAFLLHRRQDCTGKRR